MNLTIVSLYGLKRGNLGHGIIQDCGSKAVSSTRYTQSLFLVSVVSMNWELNSS